jgi:processive 1,2-diacylglycerol beta-glucosyltransferase
MKLYPNTSLYRETLKILDEIDKILENKAKTPVFSQLEHELIRFSSKMALALEEETSEQIDYKLSLLKPKLTKLVQLTNLAYHKHLLSLSENEQIEGLLEGLSKKISLFPQKRKNILILSSVMGQGHMSASKATKEGIEYLYGKDYHVTIIDFYEQIGAVFNKATVKAYEGSTKHLPAVYKYFFESTDAKWPVQLLNILNYPLNASKIEKLFKSYNPDIIISNYPIWDYLISLIIKKCGDIKFLSLVTDSISIHNAWVTANPDAHIVANEETAISLKKLGVAEEKIQALGFPVKLEFSTPSNRQEFLKDLNLNPDLYTILLLTTAQKTSETIKIIKEISSKYKDINFIVICGRNFELFPKLEPLNHKKNTRIIGWTDQMPEFIKNSDLVITKAGGATVMECIAAKKPMIITQVIPGQEMGNAELIKLHELGIIQKDAKMTLPECIDYIRKNQDRILKNLEKVSNPDAGLKIAKYIHEQVG